MSNELLHRVLAGCRAHPRVRNDENITPEEAHQAIQDLIQGMITDIGAEDWTGCRFVVATLDGRTVFELPVLAAMSAIARRKGH